MKQTGKWIELAVNIVALLIAIPYNYFHQPNEEPSADIEITDTYCKNMYSCIRKGSLYSGNVFGYSKILPREGASESERIEAAGKVTVYDVLDYNNCNVSIDDLGYYNCYTDEHQKGDITYYDESDPDISRLTYSVTLAELYE